MSTKDEALTKVVNADAVYVNGAINKIIFVLGVTAAKQQLVAAAPFFGYPIISPLVDFFLNKIGAIFYEVLAHQATFVIIDLQTGKELEEYSAARMELSRALTTGNQEAADVARSKFKETFTRLVHADGSAPL